MRKMKAVKIASGILAYAKKYNAEFSKDSLYRIVSQNTETFGTEDARVIDVLVSLKKQRGSEYLYITDGDIQDLIDDEQTFLVLCEILEAKD